MSVDYRKYKMKGTGTELSGMGSHAGQIAER